MSTLSFTRWRDARPEDLKPGVKVRIKSSASKHASFNNGGGMDKYLNTTVTIAKQSIYTDYWKIMEDGGEWYWNYSWVEVEETIPSIASGLSFKDTTEWPELKVGDKVARGPDWETSNTPHYDVGVVYETYRDTGVRVKWPDGDLGGYVYREGKHEVVKVYDTYPPKQEDADNRGLKHKIGERVKTKSGAGSDGGVIQRYDTLGGKWGYVLKYDNDPDHTSSCAWFDNEIV